MSANNKLVRAIEEAPAVPMPAGRTAIILTEEVRAALREAQDAASEPSWLRLDGFLISLKNVTFFYVGHDLDSKNGFSLYVKMDKPTSDVKLLHFPTRKEADSYLEKIFNKIQPLASPNMGKIKSELDSLTGENE